MLHHSSWRADTRLRSRLRSVRIHDSMHACLLNHMLFGAIRGDSCTRVKTPAIPQTTDINTSDDLRQSTCLYVADFDESGTKKHDVWRVQGNPLRGTFPLDRASGSTWVTALVHVEAEFYGRGASLTLINERA